jgi:hypothetical protein
MELFTLQEIRETLLKDPLSLVALLRQASLETRKDLAWFHDNHGPELIKLITQVIETVQGLENLPEIYKQMQVSVEFDADTYARVLVMQHFTQLVFERLVRERAEAHD